ncbi:Mevalonate kinase [Komagataella phaffii CBS 7435]|uniref:Mevalonate kinase n=2 Tax=Komagataella phaffii TaxID=460519 RepID=C4QVH7_KOMPG|nr:uncharacterized protein PAS_chr1-3_0187 [Komagataella phaffii GS115]AOA60549.1 GQ67_02442T0 [Komagataella phaffii]CAH2445906.1 Mevalonate kinase [Komagataella phaffii CBS 7435]AOA65635.1 GQ68_02805T0 [Komagataella phaffii GS115]CAY67250.1 Mevalonate kinase, acts in the biosynthesis of isoprenoids and sterols, including ergosterol [Komagataella phaffii GS115]CCA36354.1 Mevalonate kinase [Komagataella phaffii CBS 7435]
MDLPFVVSAPGKVIIFGEHAAVYNKPAIAAALSLRTYLLVTPNEDSELIRLEFPDIHFNKSWRKDHFPWDQKPNYNGKPSLSQELEPELVDALSLFLADITSPFHYSSAYTFLYLYISLVSKTVPGATFSVRSTLPIGAGLGSSASISVCLATAFALLDGHISKPTIGRDERTLSESADCQFIEAWSFQGEKCLHGNPSGIDNAVATHGGAVMFQRKEGSMPSVRTSMRNFPSLRLLLTNTKTARRTATLVANVSTLVTEFAKTSEFILNAIDSLTREAYILMTKPVLDAEARRRLRELIRINHGLLISLGVSHPSLEKIRMTADLLALGETKLTGAGGGGCAITLLKESVEESKVLELVEELENEGFETFETTLGGKGVGATFNPTLDPSEFIKMDRIQIEHNVWSSDWKFW